MAMKSYYVTVPVSAVRGHQCFLVKAKSEEDAIQKVKDGNGKFDGEELSVDGLNFSNAEAELNE